MEQRKQFSLRQREQNKEKSKIVKTDVSDTIGKTLNTPSCEAKSLGMSADYDFVFPELSFYCSSLQSQRTA